MSGILAVLERAGGGWHRMALEALGAALDLGRATGEPVTACVLGRDVAAAAAEIAAYGVEEPIALEHDALAAYAADAWIAALEWLIREVQPEWVVMPHTYQTRDFAPALAARFGRALHGRLHRLCHRRSGTPVFERQLFQGKLVGAVRVGNDRRPILFLSRQAPSALRSRPVPAARMAVRRPPLDPSAIRQRPESPSARPPRPSTCPRPSASSPSAGASAMKATSSWPASWPRRSARNWPLPAPSATTAGSRWNARWAVRDRPWRRSCIWPWASPAPSSTWSE